jgi:hypothetical protein
MHGVCKYLQMRGINLDKMDRQKLRKQMRFASAAALNDSAFSARELLARTLPNYFTVRNTWTERGFRVVKANKTNLVAIIGSTRDYLPDHVRGARRKDKAVPTRQVRKRKTQRIGRARWPSRVLQKPGHFLAQAKDVELPGRLRRHQGRAERLVLQRVGGKRKRKVRLLWVIPKVLRIQKRYPFARLVQREHARVYPGAFRKRLEAALLSAR